MSETIAALLPTTADPAFLPFSDRPSFSFFRFAFWPCASVIRKNCVHFKKCRNAVPFISANQTATALQRKYSTWGPMGGEVAPNHSTRKDLSCAPIAMNAGLVSDLPVGCGCSLQKRRLTKAAAEINTIPIAAVETVKPPVSSYPNPARIGASAAGMFAENSHP